MLDTTVLSIYNKISERRKRTFIMAIFWCVIVHLYIVTNLLYNHDGVVSMYCNVDALTSGRWFLEAATSFSGHMQMPVVIGIISFIYLSIMCVFTIEVLDIESYVHIFVISGIIITFPTIVCTFSYLFTADAYFLAGMLSSLAVYFTVKKSNLLYSALGCILLAFSIGIYQAYLSYAAGLYLVVLTFSVLNRKNNFVNILKEGIKYFFSLLIGVGLYYIILQVLLKINHTNLSNYRGINEMGHYSLNEIPGLLIMTIKEVIQFFFVKKMYSYIPDYIVYVNWIILVLLCIMFAFILKKTFEIKKFCLEIVFVVLTPISFNLMQIMNPQEKPHVLMILSYSLYYLLFFKVLEQFMKEYAITSRILLYVCNLLGICILLRGIVLTNECYLRLQLEQKSSFAFANRLVQSIESNENYMVNMPVLIEGNFNYTEFPTVRTDFIELSEMTGVYSDYIYYSSGQLKYYLKDSLNVVYMEVPVEEEQAIISSEEYNEMPCYPEEGAIREIDGILVVKLSELAN